MIYHAQAVWRAMEDAGLRAEDLHRSQTGVFVGAYDTMRDYQEAPDETNIRYRGGYPVTCLSVYPYLYTSRNITMMCAC
jgi:acyl transferase domain-containing protein